MRTNGTDPFSASAIRNSSCSMSVQRTLTRYAHRSSRLKNIPPLEEFLFRNTVKEFQRRVLRTIYQIPSAQTRKDLKKHLREEFEAVSTVKDIQHRKYLLSMGERQYSDVVKAMGLSR